MRLSTTFLASATDLANKKPLMMTLNGLFEELDLRGWNVYASLNDEDPTKVVLHFTSGKRPKSTKSSKYRRMNEHQQQRDENRAKRRRRKGKSKPSTQPQSQPLNAQAPAWTPVCDDRVQNDSAAVAHEPSSIEPGVQSDAMETASTSVAVSSAPTDATATVVEASSDTGNLLTQEAPPIHVTAPSVTPKTPKPPKLKEIPAEEKSSPPTCVNGIFRCYKCGKSYVTMMKFIFVRCVGFSTASVMRMVLTTINIPVGTRATCGRIRRNYGCLKIATMCDRFFPYLIIVD